MEGNYKNKYINTAHLYDLDNRGIVKDDISFYIDRAQSIKGEILEIACGTGRVSIPLARTGTHVTGLDLSPDMLTQFRKKLLDESQDVRGRIDLIEADMSKFELDKEYPLIIIPFRAFQLLTDQVQIDQCLDAIYHHLAADGIFIINTFKPYGKLDEKWIQPEKEDWIQQDPSTGLQVRRTHIRRWIDIEKQVTYPELIYYIEQNEGASERFVEKLAMKYYYESQLRDLLVSRGFKIIEEMGYYDGRPISEGPELIFVCTK